MSIKQHVQEDEDYESQVPPDSVMILRQGEVSYEGETSGGQEIWESSGHVVTMTTSVRAYNCDCMHGSVHGDKDGICKHIAAVEFFKKMRYLNEDIVREIREEYQDDE